MAELTFNECGATMVVECEECGLFHEEGKRHVHGRGGYVKVGGEFVPNRKSPAAYLMAQHESPVGRKGTR